MKDDGLPKIVLVGNRIEPNKKQFVFEWGERMSFRKDLRIVVAAWEGLKREIFSRLGKEVEPALL